MSTSFGVVTFYFIGKLVGNVADSGFDTSYFEFALIGLLVITLGGIGLREVGKTFTGEAATRTLEILLAGPTPLNRIVVGSLLVPFALGLIDMGIYLGIGYALGGVAYSAPGVLAALPILGLTVLTFVAVGIFSAAFMILTKRGEPFSLLVVQTTNLLAGTVIPVAVLPGYLQVVAHLLPAFYGLRALRALLLADSGLGDVWLDVIVLVGFNLVLLPLSMLALRGALRVARRLGTLASG